MTSAVRTRAFGGIRVRTPHASAGRRIGLFGGSFNPPHVGHMRVAETAFRRLGLDQLWWMVTPGNPLKDAAARAPIGSRLEAVRRLATHPRMRVTALEAELGEPAYTARTIAVLRRRHPHARFVWVMGADGLAQFHRWQEWRHIAALVAIAVVDRPGLRYRALAAPAAHALDRYRLPEERARQLAARKPPAWVFLSTRLERTSSSAIRAGRGRRN